MHVVKITGGLGNQMFQYAFGRSLACKLNEEVFFETSSFKKSYRPYRLSVFPNLKINLLSEGQMHKFKRKHMFTLLLHRILGRLRITFNKPEMFTKLSGFYRKPSYYCEYTNRLFDKRKGDTLYVGCFQNELYFNSIEAEIRKAFEFSAIQDKENLKTLNKIKSAENAVAIHVRRGDYLGGYFNLLSHEYYLNCINFIKSRVENPVFFVFGQDCDGFINSFVKKANITAEIIGQYNSINQCDYIDMQLMQSCKHFIIANSTFSWWGAFLARNPQKIVIAPSPFVLGKDDVICKNWVKMNSRV